MVYKVSFMDTGNTLRDNSFYAEIHRVDCRMFTGGTLSIVLAANDDALTHGFRPGRELRIIAVVAVLGHQRNIGAHAGELRTGRGDVIGGDIVAAL